LGKGEIFSDGGMIINRDIWVRLEFSLKCGERGESRMGEGFSRGEPLFMKKRKKEGSNLAIKRI